MVKIRSEIAERKCEECGESLTEENVMKIELENGSWQTIPIPLCPKCFTKSLIKKRKTSMKLP